jgi:hypothetical protein
VLIALLVPLVVLAGCTRTGPDGPAASAGSTDATAVTATATVDRAASATERTATATPFPDTTVAFPDGPKSRPARPETITAQTAADYAVRHEYRYSYNRLWSGPGTEVGMSEHSCGVRSTAERGDGYVVTVRCTAYVNEPVGGSDSTATRHADLPPWTVRYYLDGDSLVREEVPRR